MRYLYSACLALILPFLWLMLWWRYRHTDYNQRWRERWGYLTIHSKSPVLWLHAASVGEVIASPPGILLLETTFGTERIVDMLVGDQLPRIC